MAEETVFAVLSTLSKMILVPGVLALLFLLLLRSDPLLLWSAFPLLGVIFFIKNQLLKIQYNK